MKHLIYITIILMSPLPFSESISCKNENNQEIDWFVNYKFPKLDHFERSSMLGKGEAYAYITSDSKARNWQLSDEPISSPTSMIGNTLSSYYSETDKEKLTYLFYNDELPDDETGSSVGHTKGVVVFDGNSGFWLIHSVPKFPSSRSYGYPDSGYDNGQSALCITFDAETLNEIGPQLLFNAPNIYAKNLNSQMESVLDANVESLFSDNPAFIRRAPFSRITTVKSVRNQKFTVFSKDNQLHEDLYNKLIAPELKTSLYVETWRRGRGTPLDPVCGRHYSVLDVQSIAMVATNRSTNVNIEFGSTKDHSKWAISTNDKLKWVCIGDINRMASQQRRGGGSACFQSDRVWGAFKAIVENTDSCSTK